jgi:hypothetical protein
MVRSATPLPDRVKQALQAVRDRALLARSIRRYQRR